MCCEDNLFVGVAEVYVYYCSVVPHFPARSRARGSDSGAYLTSVDYMPSARYIFFSILERYRTLCTAPVKICQCFHVFFQQQPARLLLLMYLRAPILFALRDEQKTPPSRLRPSLRAGFFFNGVISSQSLTQARSSVG